MNNRKENKVICLLHTEIEQNHHGCSICGAFEKSNLHIPPENEEYPDMILRFIMSLILLLPLIILNTGIHLFHLQSFVEFAIKSNYNLLQFLLSTPVVLFSGAIIFTRAYNALESRQLSLFSLIALGIGLLYIYSIMIMMSPLLPFLSALQSLNVYFYSCALIVTITLLGEVLELRTHYQASALIKELMAFTPQVARLVKKGNLDEVISIDDIKEGYILRVRPGDRIPVDGVIIEGNATIDQSNIMGEKLPVEKSLNDFVIGGTLNVGESFIIRAEKVGNTGIISQIIDTVKNAMTSKLRIQKVASKVASYFIPSIILIAIAVFHIWFILGPSPQINYAILNSIAILICGGR